MIFDPVGGDIFDASRKFVAFEGRILIIGFVSGRSAEPRPTTCSSRTTRSWACTGASTARSTRRWSRTPTSSFTRLYAAGAIKPLVSERVPMVDAPAALSRLASRATVGKVVVLPWS